MKFVEVKMLEIRDSQQTINLYQSRGDHIVAHNASKVILNIKLHKKLK
jgi:hypothetical protein